MSLLLLRGETGTVVDPGGGPVDPARDATEAMVAQSGDVYIAPVGTPLPTLVRTTLHPSFYNIGLISGEGVQLAVAPEVSEKEAWQEQHAIRRDLDQQKIAVVFDMVQWNSENVVWAFGNRGSVVEFAPGQWRYDFPGDDSTIDERSIVIDWTDAGREFRLVFVRGTILGGLSTTMARGTLARLPVGFDVLASEGGSPGYLFLTDQPAAPVVPDDPPVDPPGGPGTFGDGLFGGGTFGGG